LRDIVVIANAASGRGTASARRQELIGLLTARGKGWEIWETEGPGSAEFLARKAAEQRVEIVAAAGGDGTLGEAANGLAGSGTALAVLPMGTGNDCSRTLGIGTNLELAVRQLFEAEPVAVDLGAVGDRLFINVAGCGFDAEVAKAVNSGHKRLKGTFAYLAAVLNTLKTFRAVPLRLEFDGEVAEENAMLCAIANCRSYGGGMLIAPKASLTDGMLDVILVREAGTLEFLRAFPKVFSGRHLSHPKVRWIRAKSVKISSPEDPLVLADGELINGLPLEFSVRPRALRIIPGPSGVP
jgi:diacylglycerol kinase (ATP)